MTRLIRKAEETQPEAANVAADHVLRQKLIEIDENVGCFEYWITGCWYTYPSKKNIITSVGVIIPNIWKNKKCSKPPTRIRILNIE